MQEDLNLAQPIWQVCHGGMLGLKYLSAVRTDLLTQNAPLLDGVVRAVMRGLADHDDDVRAVSAATLIPIASEFITLRPHAVDDLINVVWECLSHLKDDLSASTGSVMDLLAKLCSFPQVLEAMKHKASTVPSYVNGGGGGGGGEGIKEIENPGRKEWGRIEKTDFFFLFFFFVAGNPSHYWSLGYILSYATLSPAFGPPSCALS